jgi:hypothetical protein
MRCAFCQNGDISTDKDNGEESDPRTLAAMAWTLRREGCHNINSVGGEVVIHLHAIVDAIALLGRDFVRPQAPVNVMAQFRPDNFCDPASAKYRDKHAEIARRPTHMELIDSWRNPLGMAANGSAFIGCSAITVSMPLPGLRRLKCLNDWLLLRCMSPILARSVSAAPASLRLLSRGQRTQTRTRPFGCP